MPISTIDITNTIDFGRQVLNQVSANINSLLSSGLVANGNVIIRGYSSSHISLNVSTGIIYGNGSGLFSVNSRAITIGTLKNSQLQNTGIFVSAGLGTNGGGFVPLGSAVNLNLVPINSFTNSWANIAVSAAAVRDANLVIFGAAQNANLTNTGILRVAFGGTGFSAYPGINGSALIGTSSGTLQANTIRPGIGISAQYGNGSLSFAANLVAGQNVEIIGGNRIRIIAPPVASETVNGVVQLNDSTTSTSKTQVATANAVNAVNELAIARFPTPNVFGRLTEFRVYSTPGSYTWTKPLNTSHIELIMIGAGGGGAGANHGNTHGGPPANTYVYGMGGYAGALLYAKIPDSNLAPTMTVTVGYAGNSSGLSATGRVGYKGGDTIFSNTACTMHSYYANGGNGGLIISTVGGLAANVPNIHTWNSMRKPQYGFLYEWKNNFPALATAEGPPANQPQPESILKISGEPSGLFLRLSRGNVVGSFGGSVPGWCAGGWVTYSTNTDIHGGKCITYGPDGGTAAEQPNGSGFGGGGGAGAYNEARGALDPVSGASGANGLVIIKVYSRI